MWGSGSPNKVLAGFRIPSFPDPRASMGVDGGGAAPLFSVTAAADGGGTAARRRRARCTRSERPRLGGRAAVGLKSSCSKVEKSWPAVRPIHLKGPGNQDSGRKL